MGSGGTHAAQRLEERLAASRAEQSYRTYLEVRERVLSMLDGRGGAFDVSAYWREELENIEYMLDASPLVVERLRQHSYHVTGVWPYNYRTLKDANRRRHEIKLEALLELGGDELFVPEPPLLGGFGFPVDGGTVNIDTLKFYEVMIALDRGAALTAFRRPDGRRPVALEIGTGWGGFAYTFKTLFPDSTYVMVDLPELFVFSATYLMSAFPDATVRFWEPDRPMSDDDWLDADFVLLPNTALDDLMPPHLDLAINMVSFQEMTSDQVRGYVEHAHRLEAPLLYSLNRECGGYNPELTSVSELIEERYASHEVRLLDVSYGILDGKEPNRAPTSGEPVRGGYRHLIGWRRPFGPAGRG